MAVPEFNLFHRDLLPASPWRTYRQQFLALLLAVVILLSGWYMTLRSLATAGNEGAALAAASRVLQEKLEAGMAGAYIAADLRRRQELVPLLKGEAWSPYLARLHELAARTGVELRGITLEKEVLTARVAVPDLKTMVPFLQSLSREEPFREYRLVEITATGENTRGMPGEYLELTIEIRPGSAGGNDNAPVTPGLDG
ncbi:hypothetical protein [Moorella sulfitireducens (nom. illeg.)]|uniref:hypothetical protein n=1 Tax=Neomoorella sulfitireducens TaxID=2972948 RepID=UPI0021AC1ACE|nr:hypothetical protein [Moorella sulfitireducens]